MVQRKLRNTWPFVEEHTNWLHAHLSVSIHVPIIVKKILILINRPFINEPNTFRNGEKIRIFESMNNQKIMVQKIYDSTRRDYMITKYETE